MASSIKAGRKAFQVQTESWRYLLHERQDSWLRLDVEFEIHLAPCGSSGSEADRIVSSNKVRHKKNKIEKQINRLQKKRSIDLL